MRVASHPEHLPEVFVAHVDIVDEVPGPVFEFADFLSVSGSNIFLSKVLFL